MEEKYIIFGTGSGCEVFLENTTESDFEYILGFVDNNKEKQGTLFKGKTVFSPEEIKNLKYKKIIISSLYDQDIRNQLISIGINKDKITSSIRNFTICNLKQLLFLEDKKKLLKNQKISIISNYCWGLFLYRYLELEYNSPFIGCYINNDCYKKLIENFDYYIKQPANIVIRPPEFGSFCRLFLDDIFLDFFHEYNQSVLEQKWYRRLQRLDFDNLFFHWGNTPADEDFWKKTKKMKEFDYSLIISNEKSCLYSKNKEIITTDCINLIKWFNKEL